MTTQTRAALTHFSDLTDDLTELQIDILAHAVRVAWNVDELPVAVRMGCAVAGVYVSWVAIEDIDLDSLQAAADVWFDDAEAP